METFFNTHRKRATLFLYRRAEQTDLYKLAHFVRLV